MITIGQTLQYIEICQEMGVSIKPRTEREFNRILNEHKVSPAIINKASELLTSPKTADAYLELIRIQVSLRAMGLLERHHPSAMINITNFQRMLLDCNDPNTVVELTAPYNIGNLSMYGAFLTISESIYNQLDTENKLDDVFLNSNLSRLLSLYEYIEGVNDDDVVTEIVTPVTLPHIGVRQCS